jgi:hypothetical protein
MTVASFMANIKNVANGEREKVTPCSSRRPRESAVSDTMLLESLEHEHRHDVSPITLAPVRLIDALP